MSDDFIYWLFFLLTIAMAIFFGSRYMADTSLVFSLSIEVRGATQSAASTAFSSLSLEGIGNRDNITDRAHRGIILDKSVSQVRFEEALRDNLNLDERWMATSNKYISADRAVLMTELHIIDSTELPFDYEGRQINEPSVIVGLQIPVKMYSTNRDVLDVVRIIPIRTFITNWQR